MNHVASYFTTHPSSNECFETSNKLLFHKEEDATAHAATLDDKKVIPWRRTPNDKEAAKQKKRTVKSRSADQKN